MACTNQIRSNGIGAEGAAIIVDSFNAKLVTLNLGYAFPCQVNHQILVFISILDYTQELNLLLFS